MNEFAATRIGFQSSRVTVGPAVADTHDEIRSEARRIAVTVMCLDTDHTGIQIMFIRNGTPAHQRRDDRYAKNFCEFDQQRGSIGQNDTATRDNQRFFGIVEHTQCLFDLCTGRTWLGDFQWSIGIRIEFNLAHLHVQWQIDQTRPLTTGTHQIKSFLQRPGHQCRFTNRHSHFGYRSGDLFDIDSLKIFLEELGTRSLSRNRQNRSGIGNGGIKPGNHVGGGRTRGADTHPDIALLGAGIAFSHVGDTFAMTRQNMFHGAMLFQCRINRIDAGTRDTEQLGNTFFFQYIDSRFGCSHFCHEAPPG